MKIIKFLAITSVALCVASCGGNKNAENSDSISTDINVETTSVLPENQSNEENVSSEKVEETVEESVEEQSSSSTRSEDWDALLDSYDDYVTKYISYMKKAMNGDMSALSEYPALLEKAEEFSDKLGNAEGEMSSAQWNRYLKITKRLSSSATSM